MPPKTFTAAFAAYVQDKQYLAFGADPPNINPFLVHSAPGQDSHIYRVKLSSLPGTGTAAMDVTLDVLLKLFEISREDHATNLLAVLTKLKSTGGLQVRLPDRPNSFPDHRLYLLPIGGLQQPNPFIEKIETIKRLHLRPSRTDHRDPPIARSSLFTLMGAKTQNQAGFAETHTLGVQDLHGVDEFHTVASWKNAKTDLTVKLLKTRFASLQGCQSRDAFLKEIRRLHNQGRFEVVRWRREGTPNYKAALRFPDGPPPALQVRNVRQPIPQARSSSVPAKASERTPEVPRRRSFASLRADPEKVALDPPRVEAKSILGKHHLSPEHSPRVGPSRLPVTGNEPQTAETSRRGRSETSRPGNPSYGPHYRQTGLLVGGTEPSSSGRTGSQESEARARSASVRARQEAERERLKEQRREHLGY